MGCIIKGETKHFDFISAAATDCDEATMPPSTAECSAVLDGSVCDDGNDETNNDVCDGATCAGKVALVSQLTFDIAVEVAEGSDEFAEMERSIKTALATTLTRADLNCSPSDITIIGLYAGSLIVDYRVDVPAAVITSEVTTNAMEAIADPTSPVSNIVIVDASGVVVTSGAPSVLPFKTYSWTKEASSCPSTGVCGVEQSSVPDSYICQENAGLGMGTVADVSCVVTIGGKPATQTICSGSWPCPTCGDWTQNGDETGLDCGGSACAACVHTTTQTAADHETGLEDDATAEDIVNASSHISSLSETNSLDASVGSTALIVVLVASAGAMVGMLAFYRHAKLAAGAKGSVVYLADAGSASMDDKHFSRGESRQRMHSSGTERSLSVNISPSSMYDGPTGSSKKEKAVSPSSAGSMSPEERHRQYDQEHARQQERERRHRAVGQRKKSSALAQGAARRAGDEGRVVIERVRGPGPEHARRRRRDDVVRVRGAVAPVLR